MKQIEYIEESFIDWQYIVKRYGYAYRNEKKDISIYATIWYSLN